MASSSPQQPLHHADEVLLLAEGGSDGLELYRTDGTGAGTVPVDGSPSALQRLLGVVEGRAIVEQKLEEARTRLWGIRLEDGAVEALGDFDLGPPISFPGILVDHRAIRDAIVLDDRIVFAGRTATHGLEPWVTDGTPEGTRMLADLAPGETGSPSGPRPKESDPSRFVSLGANVYFTASVEPSFFGLWRTDGTSAPQQVLDLGTSSGPLVTVNDELFVLGESQHVIDGVTGQAREILLDSCAGCTVREAVRLRGRIAMLVSGADFSLWWTDGTQAGTYLATPLPPSSSQLFSNGPLVFFVSAPLGERSLWASDGTTEGTLAVLVSDDPLHQEQPVILGVFDGTLLFSARSHDESDELWRSDGTEAGTFRLTDLVPGPGSSHPSDAFTLADRVHFAATSPDVGRELFSLPRSVLDRPCASDATTECLGQRFEVSVDWLAPNTGEHGRASVVPELGTDDTSMFWFFDDQNLELAVKLLDGRAISGSHWVYYGALSDVAYWVSSTDVDTGRTITYGNPAGVQCGRGDVHAFPDEEVPPGEESGELRPGGEPPPPRPDRIDTDGPPTACGGEYAACLGGGRFRVEVDWRHPAALDVVRFALPLPGTDDTAAFWFFDAANVELLVKVLDARVINGRFWVYFGALSDVAHEIRVTDTTTGATRVYRNRQGTLCGGADVEAF